jgi:hypothetical protein
MTEAFHTDNKNNADIQGIFKRLPAKRLFLIDGFGAFITAFFLYAI